MEFEQYKSKLINHIRDNGQPFRTHGNGFVFSAIPSPAITILAHDPEGVSIGRMLTDSNGKQCIVVASRWIGGVCELTCLPVDMA